MGKKKRKPDSSSSSDSSSEESEVELPKTRSQIISRRKWRLYAAVLALAAVLVGCSCALLWDLEFRGQDDAKSTDDGTTAAAYDYGGEDGDAAAAETTTGAGEDGGEEGGEEEGEEDLPWGPWSECSETCDMGTMTREKECEDGDCESEEKECFLVPCTCNMLVLGEIPTESKVVLFGGGTQKLFNAKDGFATVWDPIESAPYWTTAAGHIYKKGQKIYSPGKKMGGMTIDIGAKFIFAGGLAKGILRMAYDKTPEPEYKWILIGLIKLPYSLLAIPEREQVWWIDAGKLNGVIEHCDYEGQNRVNFGKLRGKARGLVYDRETDKLYWTNIVGAKISSSPIDEFKISSLHTDITGAQGHDMVACGLYFWVADPKTNGGDLYRILKSGGSNFEDASGEEMQGTTSVTIYLKQ